MQSRQGAIHKWSRPIFPILWPPFSPFVVFLISKFRHFAFPSLPLWGDVVYGWPLGKIAFIWRLLQSNNTKFIRQFLGRFCNFGTIFQAIIWILFIWTFWTLFKSVFSLKFAILLILQNKINRASRFVSRSTMSL